MNDLKRLEGKTISFIEQDQNGRNSFLIIKFEEGGKLNITSFPHGDNGVGQLDIELGDIKEEDLIGKRVHSITEEFDGVNDFIIITFKDSKKMTITAFSSAENTTAGLETFVYSSEKLVAESLNEIMNENKYTDARWGQYPMYKPQYENGEDDCEIGTYKGKDDFMVNAILTNLEEWLEKHQIHDEQEEIEEIESWLDINLEDAPVAIKDAVIMKVARKYNISQNLLR